MIDYYRFFVSNPGKLNFGLSGLSNNANLQLLNSSGKAITGSYRTGTSNESGSYHLTTGDYYFKIYRKSGDTNYHLNFNLLPANLTLTSPSSGNNLEVGKNYNVTWTDNIDENVSLDLYKGNSLVQTIASSTPSDGEYLWTIPTNLADGFDYRIKISSINDSNISDFGNLFRIYKPKITVMHPNGDNRLIGGNKYWISWIDNISGSVRLDLYKGNSYADNIYVSSRYASSYLWTVPTNLAGGSDYRIKISSVNDDHIRDFSDAYFSIYKNPPQITVTNPNNNSQIEPGKNVKITWNGNISEDVRLDLYKGTSLIQEIVPSTPNDGEYLWTFPTNLAEGFDYTIKIANVSDNKISDFSNTFRIYKPKITVTNPNNGNRLDAGKAYPINWSDNISENVRIDLYKGSSLAQTISASTPSSGWYFWQIPANLAGGSDYRIKISSINDSNISDLTDNDFTIYQPEIMVTNPNGGNTLESGKSVTINWEDNISENVRIDIYKGSSLAQTIEEYLPTNGNYQTYQWNVPLDLAEGSDYKLQIVSLDNNNLNDISDDYFTVKPKIEVDTNSISSLKSGQNLKITWNDNIDEDVRINLYQGYDSLIHTIDSSTPSDGEYDWIIPANIAEGTNYRIKVESIDDSNISDFGDNFFRIYDSSSIRISVSPPISGFDALQAEVRSLIKPTNTISSRSRIDLYKGDNFVQNVYGNISNGEWWWTVPNVPSGDNYRLKITDTNDESISNFSQPFTIFRPEITVTYPIYNSRIRPDREIYIRWEDNFMEGIETIRRTDKVRIDLYRFDNGFDLVRTIDDVKTGTGGGFYLWDVPYYLKGSYVIEITSLDYRLNEKPVSHKSAPFSITDIF